MKVWIDRWIDGWMDVWIDDKKSFKNEGVCRDTCVYISNIKSTVTRLGMVLSAPPPPPHPPKNVPTHNHSSTGVMYLSNKSKHNCHITTITQVQLLCV